MRSNNDPSILSRICERAAMTIKAAACVIGVLMALPTLAMADSATFSIPTQPLPDALKQFAAQAHMQLLYQFDAVRGMKSTAVVGDIDKHVALQQLLRDTGLQVTFTAPDAATIGPVASSTSGDTGANEESKEGKTKSSDQFRMAQVDQGTGSQAALVGSDTASAEAKNASLEEIVVTAQKREERVKDVPISIVAVTADELSKRQITGIDDLQFVVPGLQLHKQAESNAVYLRGVANVIGNAPLVGVYLDEADVTAGRAQLDVDTYDLQRVEVLRGPQGTLYGEGSMGGTIRFITNNPSLTQFQANADVAGLLTEGGAPSQRVHAVVNVPLAGEVLAARVAAQFDHEGGWIDQPNANLVDINDHNIADVRTKLLWQADSQFSASAMVEIHRNNGVMDNGEDANGNYTQPFNQMTQRRVTNKYDLYNLALNYDFAATRLLSTTTYFDQDNKVYNYGWFGQFTPPPSPLFPIYLPQSSTTSHALNEELRLMSTGATAWKWTLGVFYRDFHTAFTQSSYYFAPPPAETLPTSTFPGLFEPNRSRSYAVFGDTSYTFFDRLTLGGGVRAFHDDQTVPDQKASFHSVNPRVYAEYKLSPQANLYASAAKGFRSGGFNPKAGQPTYGPESVRTYELGTKIDVLERTLSADIDVFYSDYSDYQTAAALPPDFVQLTGNVGGAKIKGVEATASWRPGAGWTLSVNGDYINAYVTSIGAARAATISLLPGDKLNYVPRYQGTLSLQRDMLWAGRPVFARLDYNLQGPSSLTVRNGGPWYHSQSDIINLLNLSAGIQWTENLSLSLFAQNLTNDRGFTEPDIIEDAANRARPRTYGFGIGVKF